MSTPALHAPPCECQTRTAGTLGERIANDLRTTTAAEWVQIARAAGALWLSWRIYKEVR